MNKLGSVISFTFKNKFKSKAFIITSIVLVVLLSIIINLPYIIQLFTSEGGSETDKIGMFDTAAPISDTLQAHYEMMEDPDFEIVIYESAGIDSEDQARIEELVLEDELKGFLQVGEAGDSGFPSLRYISHNMADFTTVFNLQAAIEPIKTHWIAEELGLTSEDVQRLSVPVSIETSVVIEGEADESGRTESQTMIAYAMVYVLVIMIFMAVTMYGNMIATEITAEKSSRVMEILISSVSPLTQMFGKIIGITLLALLQISIFVIIIIGNIMLPHNIEVIESFNISLADVDWSLIAYFVLFYLMAFFLYSTIFAGLGSIISRTEDLGTAVTPLTFLTLAGFYIAIFGINTPEAAFVKVTSFIPFFTPFIMFLRIGLGDPAWWEVWLSIAILAITIYLMGWLAAKIYRTGVLMYGKRPTWKELRKAMKAYKI